MPAGRPSQYNPKFCELVIPILAEGASIEEIGLELGIGYTTVYEYMEKYPEFAQAIKKGRELSKGWWLKEGRKALRDKDFSYTGWYMNMKNRFGWADKQETNVNAIIKQEDALKDLE